MTLGEFLLARIAEDERVALDAAGYESRVYWDDATDRKFLRAASVAHYARHDPARVLAECEAKRRIVGLYSSVQFGEGVDGRPVPLGGAGPEVYWEAVCILALPYADHPDYRGEWRP